MTRRRGPPAPAVLEKTRSYVGLLVEASDEERQRALVRFEILRPCLEQGVALKAAAEQSGLSARTLERWMIAYRRDGMRGLLRKKRSDRNRCRKCPEQMQTLVEGLALHQPALSAAAVHRTVAEIASEQGWKTPSYRWVCAVVQALDPSLVCLAHEGSKAYRERFDLLHRREAARSNEIWQADHTLLDIWLLDERDMPRRPWLTCIIDDYSRAVGGYFVGFDAPSALVTSLALHQAIWRKDDPRWYVCGTPEKFYTDHGSDFTSRHLEQVAADLKMQLVFSTPGMPRGRGRIERFFETINQLFLCHLPGYPGSKGARPNARFRLAEFEQRLRDFLLDDYHQRQHSGTAALPQRRWEAGGFLPRLPESLEQLDLLLLTVARTRRVRQDGVHFQNLRYMEPTLAGYVGQDVTIRYDPRDLAEIRVYLENQFVCRAICQELSGQTVSLKEIIRARNRRRRDLKGQLKTHSAVVEQWLAVHRPEPEPQDTTIAETAPTRTPKLKRYHND